MTVLGIDLGSDTIKVVEMAKARGGFKLLNYGITPTPPDAIVDGDVRDPEMVGDALKQLLKQFKFKSNRCVSAVQGQKSTVVRLIELPRMAPKELGESMQFEIERHIPFAASEIIIDYTVVKRPGEDADSPNMEVLFAAVQEQVVQLHVEALLRAKLKPKAIDVQPLALSRALVEAPSEGRGLGETVAIVNIGATVTDLSIIRDGLLHFPRAIPLAGRAITQRLSEGLGISEAQAERQKREHASVRPLPPGAVPVVEPEPVAEETVVASDPLDFTDAFSTDLADDSDVGFGGTGVDTVGSGFSFEDSEPGAVVHLPEEDDGRSPLDLGDSDTDGPSFDFGFGDDETSHSLSPADDEEEEPPVPDDEFSFSFDETSDETDEAAGPDFSFDETVEEPGEAPAFELDEPAAAEPPEAEFALEDDTVAEPELDLAVDDEDEGDGFAFDLADEAPAEEPPTVADDEVGFDFALGETDSETVAEDETIDDDLGFDFSLGETDSGSSVPSAPGETGATEVGSSFDLGDLTASDDDEGFDLGGLGDETLEAAGMAFDIADIGSVTADTPAPPVASLSGLDEAHQVRQVIEPVVREIAGEIGRSLDYYRSRFEGSLVDRVVLVGGTARIDGLVEFLEEELGLPVDQGDPLATVTVANGRLTDEDLRRDAPVLAVAVGLALRELM